MVDFGCSDAISMTTGPLCSCELPLSNRDPDDFTEAPPPENRYKRYIFVFQKQICISTNRSILSGVWMPSKKDERKCFFSLLRVIKCFKNVFS